MTDEKVATDLWVLRTIALWLWGCLGLIKGLQGRGFWYGKVATELNVSGDRCHALSSDGGDAFFLFAHGPP